MPDAADAGKTEEAGRASPHEQQLRRGFRWMRFESSLETAWRADQFRDGLKFLRINLVLLAAIIFAIIQIDRVVMPELTAAVPDELRLGVMVPILMLGLGVSFLRGADVWYPRVMSALMPLALMAIAWIGLWAWSQGEDRLFVRLVIATVAVYFVLGLRFRSAIVANLLTIVFYAAAAAGWSMPGIELTQYLAMLLITSVICAAGAYNLEYARRTAWLEGRLLAEAALQDGLTGIHNRRRLDEHLQRVWHQCMRDHKPIALLFADIDHFKAYNDLYGHQAGDEALKAVAAVLARFARRPLDIAARFGGEEFAIVLHDTNREHALRIGENIMEAVRRLGIVHGASSAAQVLTISMGIACVVPVAKRSCAGLLQLADQALYAAKDAGRNQARALEAEYEHMKTGYFHRHAAVLGGSGKPQ
ncbi:MAG TPA: diguanylate cyclase [Steroidobacteraceae bacterium]